MVTRRKLRTFLTTLALYAGAMALIGYFGVNAYTGAYGLKAKQDLDQSYASLSEELARMRKERSEWQHKVALLKAESIDPDMLDERARAVLNYLDHREMTLVLPAR